MNLTRIIIVLLVLYGAVHLFIQARSGVLKVGDSDQDLMLISREDRPQAFWFTLAFSYLVLGIMLAVAILLP